jgi:hypothetical protein
MTKIEITERYTMSMPDYFTNFKKSVQLVDAERREKIEEKDAAKKQAVETFCYNFRKMIDVQLLSMLHLGTAMHIKSVERTSIVGSKGFIYDPMLCKSAVKNHLAERYGAQRIYYGLERRHTDDSTSGVRIEVLPEVNGINIYAWDMRK